MLSLPASLFSPTKAFVSADFPTPGSPTSTTLTSALGFVVEVGVVVVVAIADRYCAQLSHIPKILHLFHNNLTPA